VILTAALALLLAPAVSQAQFKQGDWELTLSGNGANGPDFDGISFAAAAGLGYFVADQFEVGVKQTIGYSDLAGSDLNGSTRVFGDFHFDFGVWQPYLGANIGYAYGDSVSDSFFAAPEGGVKYFLNDTTFVFFSIEYQWFFDEGEDADNSLSEGQFLYGLGIGVRL
jgi:hypothetical protein